jgi:hypothetical protein
MFICLHQYIRFRSLTVRVKKIFFSRKLELRYCFVAAALPWWDAVYRKDMTSLPTRCFRSCDIACGRLKKLKKLMFANFLTRKKEQKKYFDTEIRLHIAKLQYESWSHRRIMVWILVGIEDFSPAFSDRLWGSPCLLFRGRRGFFLWG